MTVSAIALNIFTQWSFWVSVGVLAGTYGIFACGLQLNVGFTGVINFGQAGFMAIGAYTMGISVVQLGLSFWVSLPIAVLVAMAAGVLIGLPSLRLRADYFAIVTLAFSEIIRYTAMNARQLTGGNEGLIGFDSEWQRLSGDIQDALAPVGLDGEFLLPLLLVTWATLAVLTLGLRWTQASPWGRVLRAIREDEDAARALGKNVFAYKLQSIAIAAGIGRMSGSSWNFGGDLLG